MNKGFQVGWWLIILTIVLMTVVPIPFIGWIADGDNAIAEYTVSILGELALLLPSALGILYIRLAEKKDAPAEPIREIISIKKVKPSAILLGIPAMLGAQYFITYLTLPVQAVLIALFGEETATSQMLIPSGAGEYIIAFTALCIAAPIAEEFLCRGVLMKLFGKYGIATALISSSVAFTLLHFEARTFIQILFVGLLLGIFRICTGSVIPGIIMHCANNLLSFCQMTMLAENEIIPLVICIALAVLFVPVMFLLFSKYDKHFEKPDIPMTVTKTGFSLGACICIGLFAVYNFGMFLEHIINL